MCIARGRWGDLRRWNWDGDFIVHECIVPSSRTAVGSDRQYDIDVREFIVSERNEVVRRTIHQELRRHMLLLPDGNWERFWSREPGAFDYRVRVIADFVGERIAYPQQPPRAGRRAATRDPWQFPDETLALGTGDCEDRALVIASLMLASGISSFNFRVVLGKLWAGGLEHDHVWVMYKNEDGQWSVVDPPPARDRAHAATSRRRMRSGGRSASRGKSEGPPRYEPYFLFNDVHLWAVRRPDNREPMRNWLLREWNRIDPSFHGEVHLSILEEALHAIAPQLLHKLEGYFHRPFLNLIGPIVDDIDRMTYDPVFHFDNGYIREGWEHVDRYLTQFRDDQSNVRSFAIAAHAIADFYAHASYSHFAAAHLIEGKLPLFDPRQQPLGGQPAPDYSSGAFRLGPKSPFTVNHAVWGDRPASEALKAWQGQIVSGRYAQDSDTQPGVINAVTEGFTWIPKPYLDAPDFYWRGCLPHHNEIAVDEAGVTGHKLYPDPKDYDKHFDLRRSAAVRHVRLAFVNAATNRDLWTGVEAAPSQSVPAGD